MSSFLHSVNVQWKRICISQESFADCTLWQMGMSVTPKPKSFQPTLKVFDHNYCS